MISYAIITERYKMVP